MLYTIIGLRNGNSTIVHLNDVFEFKFIYVINFKLSSLFKKGIYLPSHVAIFSNMAFCTINMNWHLV